MADNKKNYDEVNEKAKTETTETGEATKTEATEAETIEEVVEQKTVIIGKQVQQYVKDFSTGEMGYSNKISVAIAVDEEQGEGVGSLAETYNISERDESFMDTYARADVGDACIIKIQKGVSAATKKGYSRVIAFMIKKPDGSIYGLDW